MNEIVRRHRIADVSGLLGKDRTPWGTIRPGLRTNSPSHPTDNPHIMNHPAFTNRMPPAPAPSRPALCERADVRAWLGPRRAGRRTLG
ncbi:MAG TPA: hypothetical protein VII47_09875 [Actinomycetota bacterium]